MLVVLVTLVQVMLRLVKRHQCENLAATRKAGLDRCTSGGRCALHDGPANTLSGAIVANSKMLERDGLGTEERHAWHGDFRSGVSGRHSGRPAGVVCRRASAQ